VRIVTTQSAEGARQWQPIETAPKDGTEILGWRHDCDCLLIRWACAEEFLTESEIDQGDWSENDLFANDWFCADFIAGSRLEGSETPTHWMHLPGAPASGRQKPSIHDPGAFPPGQCSPELGQVLSDALDEIPADSRQECKHPESARRDYWGGDICGDCGHSMPAEKDHTP